jgi:tripartite-type tricarboxylate transporter receptor subunit TctC
LPWVSLLTQRIITAIGALLFIAGMASAQTYPTKSPRLLVGFLAGGGVDITGRILANKLTEFWGQAVTVDNRPGAGGTIAATIAAKSAADGYTFIVCNAASHGIAPSVYKNLPYDPTKDSTAISLIGSTPNVMVIHPSLPATNVKAFIALAKANPGKVSYGSSGVGTTTHLGVELFKTMAGVNILHVPYKGGAQSGTDLVAGQVQLLITNLPEQVGYIKAGRVRALAVSTPKRSSLMPELPTIAEAGLPGYEVMVWYGVCGPAGIPRDLVQRVNADVVKAISNADTKRLYAEQGVDVAPNTPEQFAAFIQSEVSKWAKVVKASGISLD